MALITCPKCGKQFSDRADKCPQCGITKEDAVVLLKKQEEEIRLAAEREAAERERLRKEREAREAEEARIRAEQRAAWWAANKKRIIIILASIVGLIIAIFVVVKILDAVAKKKAIAEAYELIEQGDKLFAQNRFNDALALYDKARQKTDNSEVRNVLTKKHDELSKAKREANLVEAQKLEQEGDELFAKAQYEQAEKKYHAAIVLLDEDPALKQKQTNSSWCAATLQNAQTAEKETRYDDAAKHYSDLYAVHSLAKYQSKVNAMKQKAKQTTQTSNDVYDLVVGSFAGEVDEALQKLRAKGFSNAFVVPIVDNNGRTMRRVIAKRAYSKAEALQVQNALKNKQVKSWIWHH